MAIDANQIRKKYSEKFKCSQKKNLDLVMKDAKNMSLNLSRIVKLEKLEKFDNQISSDYFCITNHYIATKKNFKSKGSKELKSLPYDYLNCEALNHDFSRIYQINPSNSLNIYGDYSCKHLEYLIAKISKHLQKSHTESKELIKSLLNIQLKPCFMDKKSSKNSEDLFFNSKFCVICLRYCCMTHFSFKKPFTSQLELSTFRDPLQIYYKNWKNKYLFNESESEKSMKWLISYKCPFSSSAPLNFSPYFTYSKKILANYSNFSQCSTSLILSVSCDHTVCNELSSSPSQILSSKWATFPKVLAKNSTSPNCSCLNCDDSCPCIQGFFRSQSKSFESRGYCEKYCKCSYLCPHKFLGCDCTETCLSPNCVCFINHRECDPFLCRSCCAYTELCCGRPSCCNLRSQRSQKKKIFVGKSLIKNAGIGVFAKEKIEAHEFISEYTGELISNNEADRRGSIYDLFEHSFLFGIDCMRSIDATFYGNKIRFVNHKPRTLSNCESELWRVNGETKVLIFAKRCISKYEELYFDYKYPETVPYKWFQNLKPQTLPNNF